MTRFRIAIGTLLLATTAAHAQAEPVQPDRGAAANAYDRGTAAYLSGKYSQAGGWFETAYRLAPAPAALQQAIKSHLRAENNARAATLALELQRAYADQPELREFGKEVVEEAAPKLLRIEVGCSGCEVAVAGRVQPSTSFFVDPERTHVVSATFETGNVTQGVAGGAGETLNVTFRAPPPPPMAAARTSGAAAVGREAPTKPLPPIATYIAAGVTVALGVATAVSGVAANHLGSRYDDAVSAYDEALSELDNAGCNSPASANVDECASLYDQSTALYSRAASRLERGEDAETRTNILLGTTLAAAAASAAIAILFTEWDARPSNSPKASLSVARSGTAQATMALRF